MSLNQFLQEATKPASTLDEAKEKRNSTVGSITAPKLAELFSNHETSQPSPLTNNEKNLIQQLKLLEVFDYSENLPHITCGSTIISIGNNNSFCESPIEEIQLDEIDVPEKKPSIQLFPFLDNANPSINLLLISLIKNRIPRFIGRKYLFQTNNILWNRIEWFETPVAAPIKKIRET